jgi:hypothetical protein
VLRHDHEPLGRAGASALGEDGVRAGRLVEHLDLQVEVVERPRGEAIAVERWARRRVGGHGH